MAANIYDFESASIPVKRKSTDMVEPTTRDNESLESVDTATQEDQALTTLNVTALSDEDAREQAVMITTKAKLS